MPSLSLDFSAVEVIVLPVIFTLISLLFAASAAKAPMPARPPPDTPNAFKTVFALSCAIMLTFLAAIFVPSIVISLLPVVLTSPTATVAPITPTLP